MNKEVVQLVYVGSYPIFFYSTFLLKNADMHPLTSIININSYSIITKRKSEFSGYMDLS